MDLVALDTPSEENDQSWVTGDLMKIWLSDLDNANIGLSHYKQYLLRIIVRHFQFISSFNKSALRVDKYRATH
jgi:hypothetical protein